MKSLIIRLSQEDVRYYKEINWGARATLNIPGDLKKNLQKFREYLRDGIARRGPEEIINKGLGIDFFVRLGSGLFEAVFDNFELQHLLDFDRSAIKVFRLNFEITSDELINYPWELMHNGKDWLWNSGFSIVRYTPDPNKRTISVRPPLRLLSLVSIPPGYLPNDPENIQKEIEAIVDKINKEQGFELIRFISLTNTPTNVIRNEIDKHRPHIFLFIGHGAIEGEGSVIKLVKSNEVTKKEEEDPYDYQKVKDLFSCPGTENLGLVILSGCRTAKGQKSTAQAVIKAGVPNCIGILERAYIEDAFYKFPQEFLTNFLNNFFTNNLSIEIGFNEAKRAIRLDDFGTPEWAIPCLFINYQSETVFTGLAEINAVRNYLQKVKEQRLNARKQERELGEGNEFIEPSLKLRIKKKEIPPFQREKGEKPVDFVPFKIDDLVLSLKSQRYFICADSGTGKTTILKELLLKIASKEIECDLVPVCFHLSQLKHCNNIKSLRDSLPGYFPKSLFDDLHRNKRLLFLLDGLDQVDDRSNFYTLFSGSEVFGENRIIITGRPYIYNVFSTLLDQYAFVTIETFDSNQIKRYLGNYFEDLNVKRFQKSSPFIFGIPMVLKLIKELAETKQLSGLKTRSDLYRKIIETIFRVEQELINMRNKGEIKWTDEELIEKFADLSYHSSKNKDIGTISRKNVSKYCEQLRIDREKILLLTHCGILCNILESEEASDYFFRHQSFQEYFAALELRERIFEDSKMNYDVIIDHLEYTYWDDVWLFLIGALEHHEAKQIIEYIEKYDYYLAGYCLAGYKGNKGDFQYLIDRLFEEIKRDKASNVLSKIADPKIEDRLIGLLIGLLNDDSVRWSVFRALGEIKSEKAAEPLIGLLKDEDPSVRQEAAKALGEIKSEKAVEPLIGLSEDKDFDVRYAAFGALGEIKSEKAVEPLIGLLKDEDPSVRWDATEALGEICASLNPRYQDRLVLRLLNLTNKKDIHHKAYTNSIKEIKEATGRRFLRITQK